MEQRRELIEETKNEPSYVWRYMGLDKFINLLHEEKIYFPTPSQFSDPNEIIYKEINGKKVGQKKASSILGVSCWHNNSNENILMWKTYVTNNYGIAIKVKKEELLSAIRNKSIKLYYKDIEYLEPEQYTKLNNSLSNHDLPIANNKSHEEFFFSKTIEYKAENEFRLLIVNPDYLLARKQGEDSRKKYLSELQKNGLGFLIPFNIHAIDEIVLHPQFPEYMKIALELLCEKKKLNCPIKESIVQELIK